MNSPTRNLNKNSSSGSLKGSADGYAGKGIMHSSSIKRLADLDNEDHAGKSLVDSSSMI